MKKTLPVLALSTMMATAPAFAQSSTQANYNTAVVNSQVATPQAINTAQADLNFVFDNTENLQTMAMTNEQMAETQGAWLTYAGAGAVGAYFGYMNYASSVPKNQRTTAGYVTAIGTGAAGGALTITPIGATRAALVGGTVGYIGSQAATRVGK